MLFDRTVGSGTTVLNSLVDSVCKWVQGGAGAPPISPPAQLARRQPWQG